MRYVCHLMLRQIPKNRNDVILKPIYQININNYDFFKKGKFIYKSSIREEKLNLKRDDFISIVDINVDFLRDIDYNKIKEEEPNSLERLLYIFVCDNQRELDMLYLGNKIMASVQEKIRVLTGDFAQDLYYDPEELKKQCDYELGEKDTKIAIAKNLIKINMKTKEIAKVTGLSEKEVNDLINN